MKAGLKPPFQAKTNRNFLLQYLTHCRRRGHTCALQRCAIKPRRGKSKKVSISPCRGRVAPTCDLQQLPYQLGHAYKSREVSKKKKDPGVDHPRPSRPGGRSQAWTWPRTASACESPPRRAARRQDVSALPRSASDPPSRSPSGCPDFNPPLGGAGPASCCLCWSAVAMLTTAACFGRAGLTSVVSKPPP